MTLMWLFGACCVGVIVVIWLGLWHVSRQHAAWVEDWPESPEAERSPWEQESH